MAVKRYIQFEYLFWLTCLIRRNSFPSVSIGASTYRNRALLLMVKDTKPLIKANVDFEDPMENIGVFKSYRAKHMWADHMLPWRKEFGIDTIIQVTMVCRVSSSRVCKSLCSKVTCSSNFTFIKYNFGFSRVPVKDTKQLIKANVRMKIVHHTWHTEADLKKLDTRRKREIVMTLMILTAAYTILSQQGLAERRKFDRSSFTVVAKVACKLVKLT
ncbi:hypothetical protein CUMW_254590 [Citrus unshiu]|nr:hypothetical protein CUMW_254590 [Citrus unshiu]